jgi:hypothetical protein
MFHDLSGLHCSTFFPDRKEPIVTECSCPTSDLVEAPENILVDRR